MNKKQVQYFFFISWVLFSSFNSKADMKPMSISIEISTSKDIYRESENIPILITITNKTNLQKIPVILPKTQNGNSLFQVQIYDQAKNVFLPRALGNISYSIHQKCTDTAATSIQWLKPGEKCSINLIIQNGWTPKNLYDAFLQTINTPLFAGQYKIKIQYNPRLYNAADSYYDYYTDHEYAYFQNTKKPNFPLGGLESNTIPVKVKRTTDTLIYYHHHTLHVKKVTDLFYYFREYPYKIQQDTSLEHLSNILPDSFSQTKNEYYYSQFNTAYNEFIQRFENGNIKMYRKFRNQCPEAIYEIYFNDLGMKTKEIQKSPQGAVYQVQYHQPSGQIHDEEYTSGDGSLGYRVIWHYTDKGEFTHKDFLPFNPCQNIELELFSD